MAGGKTVKGNPFRAKMLYHKGFHPIDHFPLRYNIQAYPKSGNSHFFVENFPQLPQSFQQRSAHSKSYGTAFVFG
jgi:hypothetical protein